MHCCYMCILYFKTSSLVCLNVLHCRDLSENKNISHLLSVLIVYVFIYWENCTPRRQFPSSSSPFILSRRASTRKQHGHPGFGSICWNAEACLTWIMTGILTRSSPFLSCSFFLYSTASSTFTLWLLYFLPCFVLTKNTIFITISPDHTQHLLLGCFNKLDSNLVARKKTNKQTNKKKKKKKKKK